MPLQRPVALCTSTGSTHFQCLTGSDDRFLARFSKVTPPKFLAVSAYEDFCKAAKKVQNTKQELCVSNDKPTARSQADEVAAIQAASESLSQKEFNGTSALRIKRLRVAVDVDEVLGSFLSSLNKFIAERHLLQYKISEYHVYDFMKVWGCSQAEANDRVHAFFESEHFKDGIIPIPGAYQSLLQLAEFCHLVIVTSRQHVIRSQTLDWIERHYPGIFSDVYFGNHFALKGQ